jgi:hypothetical protein
MNLKLNFLQIFILVFSVSTFLVSCSNESVEQEKVSATADVLSQNKNFLNISSEMLNYSQFIKETIKNNKLSSSEVTNRIDIILNSDLSSEEQISELSTLLETDLNERIKENARIIDSNWKILNSEFNNLDEQLLTDTFNYGLNLDNQTLARGDCGWRYSLCLGGAFSGAVLCHAGCDTTALALTAGLGIPACVALCGTLQVFASVQCYDSYCAGE